MICAIVLAAGESRRMGVQKLLLPFGGKTVIAHIVDKLLDGKADKVLVVVGHEGPRVTGELAGRAVTVVENPDYKKGMLSSMRCGLRALPDDCEAVLVALGDQPSITSQLVAEVVRAFAATDKGIVVPTHQGKRGHPLIFSAHYRDEILAEFDDVGLRGLLRVHPDDVLELPISTSAILSDMDYPEDYRRELRLSEGQGKETPKSSGD